MVRIQEMLEIEVQEAAEVVLNQALLVVEQVVLVKSDIDFWP